MCILRVLNFWLLVFKHIFLVFRGLNALVDT